MIARTVKVERIEKTTVLLTAALAVLCFVTGVGDAPSVLFGGVVSVVNLRLIRMVVSRLMSPDAAGRGFSQVVTIKFLLLLALLAVALKRLPIDAVSFLVGGGSLFAAIVLEALLLGEPSRERDDGAGSR
jgi:ATP synthase I chain